MTSERTILKQTGMSRVVPIAVWVFCVLAIADSIIEGSSSFALHTIVALAGVSLAVWIILFSPHFAVDAEGITIVNPMRVVHVPFGALVDVRVGVATAVIARYEEGRERKVTAWNAPAAKRRRPVRTVGGIGGPGAAGLVTQEADVLRALPKPDPAKPRNDPASHVPLAVDHFRTPWEQAHPGGDSTAVATISLRWREWLALALIIALNVAIRLR